MTVEVDGFGHFCAHRKGKTSAVELCNPTQDDRGQTMRTAVPYQCSPSSGWPVK